MEEVVIGAGREWLTLYGPLGLGWLVSVALGFVIRALWKHNLTLQSEQLERERQAIEVRERMIAAIRENTAALRSYQQWVRERIDREG